MKKLFILIALLSFSCSKKNPVIVNESDSHIPEWINPSDPLQAVGIASKSKGGLQYSIKIAELDAKANLASKIQSQVSRITKNALRSAKINGNDDVEEFFAQATKEVVKNIPLSGVVRLKMFINEDETVFVLIEMRPGNYKKLLTKSENNIIKGLNQSKLSRDSITKSEEATRVIFDELETD